MGTANLVVAGVSLGVGLLSRLLGGKPNKAEAPNKTLADVQAITSSETEPVPIVYGTVRIGGNILWMGNFQVRTDSVGGHMGKGGDVDTPVVTKYSVSLAVGICEGPDINLLRMWSNDREVAIPNASVSFKDGSTTQTPGGHVVGFTPKLEEGWRNLAYVVLANWDLGTGTTVPNFQFEVSSLSELCNGSETWALSDPSPTTVERVFGIAVWNGELYCMWEVGDDSEIIKSFKWNPTTTTWAETGSFDLVNQTWSALGFSDLQNLGNTLIFSIHDAASLNNAKIIRWNGSIWVDVSPPPPIGLQQVDVQPWQMTASSAISATLYCIGRMDGGNGILWRSLDSGVIWTVLDDNVPSIDGSARNGIAIWEGDVYIIVRRAGSNDTIIMKRTAVNTYTTEWTSSSGFTGTWLWNLNDEELIGLGNGVIVSKTPTGAFTENTFPAGMDAGILLSRAVKIGDNLFITGTFSNELKLMTRPVGDTAWVLAPICPTLNTSADSDIHHLAYDGDTFHLPVDTDVDSVGQIARLDIGLAEANDANPIRIIEDLISNTRYGLGSPNKIDLVSFNAREAEMDFGISMVIRGRETARNIITNILMLTRSRMFIRNGKFTLASLDDFTVTQSMIVDSTFKDPKWEPRAITASANRVLVEYFDRNQAYRPSFAEARDEGDEDLTQSLRTETFRSGVVIDRDKVREVAFDILTQSLHRGMTFGVEASTKYLSTEPGDLVRVDHSIVGTFRDIRVVSIKNQNELLRIEGYEDNTALALAVTALTQASEADEIVTSLDGNVESDNVFEVPRKQSNEVLSVSPLFGSATPVSAFSSASLYHSFDNSAYSLVASGISASVVGTLLGGLSVGWHYSKDTKLRVGINHGLPTGTTHTGLFRGDKLFIVGNEVMFFEDVTALPGSILEISGFVRGKWDTPIELHSTGDVAYMAEPVNLRANTILGRDQTGIAQFFKITSVSVGGEETDLSSVTEIPLTPVGLGWRPAIAGNLINTVVGVTATFRWRKLSALHGAGSFAPIKSPAQDAIMEDNFKDYQVEVKVDDVVVRTTTTSALTFTYTFDQNVADNGSFKDHYDVCVSGRNQFLELSRISCITVGQAAPPTPPTAVMYVIGGQDGGAPTQSDENDMYTAATNVWLNKTVLPDDIQYAMIDSIDTDIFVIGGFDGVAARLDTVHIYDTVLDTWSTGATMTTKRSHAASEAVDGKIYVIAGGVSGGFTGVNEEYTPLPTNSWASKTAIRAAHEVDAPATGVVNGKIYVIGGWNGASTKLVSEYNVSGDSWAIMTDKATIVQAAAYATVNNKIYVIQGFSTVNEKLNLAYDPGLDTWDLGLTDHTRTMRISFAGVIDSVIYVTGGWDGASYHKELDKYDPADDASGWTALTDMTTARYGAQKAIPM